MSCTFEGYLQNEPDALVTLAEGCPFEKSFKVNLSPDFDPKNIQSVNCF
jgi:hypothetical protein